MSTNPHYVYYPESDGRPMADNTKQFQWIVTIKEGLDALLEKDFVAGDLLWYPVQGNTRLCQAPDVLVAVGRPKGHRGSYKQWEEDNCAPQVVFEVLSPGNTVIEMLKKFQFYNRHGVEEYYIYDPDQNELFGWLRLREDLTEINDLQGWVSPRLGIRFEKNEITLEIYRPDGRKFESFQELEKRAEAERQRAEAERQRAEAEHQRAERLAEKLRALGVDPDQV